MKSLSVAFLGAFCFWAASLGARAQVQVSAQTERSSFLLFERVDLLVDVVNTSGSDLILDNDEGHPWLSFLLTKSDRLPVHQERTSNFRQLALKAGESKVLRVNLTPLFSFREEGDYLATAVVDLPGAGQLTSQAVPFHVLKGRTVWSQTRPVNGSERVYSLVRFSPRSDITSLYLRVENPEENIVYTNLSLGEMVSSVDPDVFFDPASNIHILQPIGMGTYLYSRADIDGKILHQTTFKTFNQIPPRLRKMEDGNVIVAGGLEQNPNEPREKLHEAQGPQKPDSAGSMQ